MPTRPSHDILHQKIGRQKLVLQLKIQTSHFITFPPCLLFVPGETTKILPKNITVENVEGSLLSHFLLMSTKCLHFLYTTYQLIQKQLYFVPFYINAFTKLTHFKQFIFLFNKNIFMFVSQIPSLLDDWASGCL